MFAVELNSGFSDQVQSLAAVRDELIRGRLSRDTIPADIAHYIQSRGLYSDNNQEEIQ